MDARTYTYRHPAPIPTVKPKDPAPIPTVKPKDPAPIPTAFLNYPQSLNLFFYGILALVRGLHFGDKIE
jgi:hypothetical protein